MAVAGLIIKYVPEMKENAQNILNGTSGLEIVSENDNYEFVATLEADNLKNLQLTCQDLEKKSEIVGVYPSYVSTEDEIK